MTAAAAHLGPWTVDDLLALPDDGNRHELVDGALVMSPPPSPGHQLMSGQLFRMLSHVAQKQALPVRVIEAVGVRIDDHVLVPDLVVVSSEADISAPVLHKNHVDLVVEIVSPGSATRDRTEKPYLYAEAGIPHFWWIETSDYRGRDQPLPVLIAYELTGIAEYDIKHTVGAGGTFYAEDPIPFELDPAELRPR